MYDDIDVSSIIAELGPMPDRIKKQIQAVIRDHYREHPEQLEKLIRRHPKAS